ncbi:glutamate-1-semialdehyde 2,1-aminomutase [Spirochaetia bacterium 38H-sp]|uniref:Glutamate-1-semialdehyde 2,1-aminomutase n=1 Tax=Rarispira pelagica TaxID=3141764 RepID=A0ABU9U9U1_9SPIR
MKRTLLVGGVNSPVRTFAAVSEPPLICSYARGSFLYDTQGNKYLDFIGGWGALIHGHSNPRIRRALKKVQTSGILYGLTHDGEEKLANKIKSFIPFIEKIRFLNSGTEAAMTAIRVARAATKREKILMFSGCYHGHADSFLTKMGSGGATLSLPLSEGIPHGVLNKTIVIRYNDTEGLRKAFHDNPDIAALIIEPVAGNMGLVPAKKDFLTEARKLCDKFGTILIFDEIMCGFRASYGSVAELYNIFPDIILLGKVIGGGAPVGAIAGKENLMSLLSPEGPVYQAGTFSGNPLTCNLGLAALIEIEKNRNINHLENLGFIMDSILSDTKRITFVRLGSMCCLFFLSEAPENREDVDRQNRDVFSNFHKKLRAKGILIPPSPYETWFLNTAMKERDIKNAALIIRNTAEEVLNT